MSYSLTAHSPYEGLNMVLNGTKGRMEIKRVSRSSIAYNEENCDTVKVYNRKGEEIGIRVPSVSGEGHGGADGRLRDFLFRERGEDPLGQMADLKAGMMSIGIGMAANISMAESRRVRLSEFYGPQE